MALPAWENIRFRLHSNLRHQMVAWWSLDEASGTRVDSHGSNDLTASGAPGSRTGVVNDAADLDDAASQYLSIVDNDDVSLDGSSFAWSFWGYLDDKSANHFFLNKSTGSLDEIRCYYIAATDRFAVILFDDSGTSVATLIEDDLGSPSAGAWYHFYVGLDIHAQQLTLRINDQYETTQLVTGAVAQTAGTLYLGAFRGAVQFLDGALDEVALWKRPLSSAEITYLYNSGGGRAYSETTGGLVLATLETGGNSDVRFPITIRRGLQGGFSSRIARVGNMSLTLNNQGYQYNPLHANAQEGFEEGVDCSLDLYYDGVWYSQFRGLIDDISPSPFAWGGLKTDIACSDEIARLQAEEVGAEVLQTNVRADEVADTLISRVYTPVGTDYSAGQSTFPYVGFNSRQNIMQALVMLVDSEGFPSCLYADAEGTMVFEDRDARRTRTTVDWTLDNTMSGLTLGRKRSDVYSQVVATIHPADVGVSNEILGSVSSVATIAPGETRTIRVPYRDPNDETIKQILGDAIVTVVVNTDIIIKDKSSGGDDISANFAITHNKGANSSEIILTNNGTKNGFVQKLQIRGTAIRFYEDIDLTAGSGAGVKNVLPVNMPFNDSVNEAVNLANRLANSYGAPVYEVTDLYVRPRNATLMLMLLSAEISDHVSLTEDITSLSADKYFINDINKRIDGGGYLEAHYTLERAGATLGWLLGVVGRSELGQTTYVG